MKHRPAFMNTVPGEHVLWRCFMLALLCTFLLIIAILAGGCSGDTGYLPDNEDNNMLTGGEDVHEAETGGDNEAAAFLGKTYAETEAYFGEGGEKGTWQGSHYLYYEDEGIVFYFYRPDASAQVIAIDLLQNSTLDLGGVQVGDTITEIKNILGQPASEGPDEHDGSGYVIAYNIDGVIIYFSADTLAGATTKAMIKPELD